MKITASYFDMLDSQDQARRNKVKTAWEYYHGHFKNQLRVTDGIDDNINVNYARMVTDRKVEGLWGSDDLPITIKDSDEAQEVWDKWFEKVNGPVLLIKAGQQGSVSGDLFLRLHDSGDDGEPEVYIWDSECVLVETDPSDHTKEVRYIYATQTTTEINGKRVILRKRQEVAKQDDGSWEIRDFIATNHGPLKQFGETVFWNYTVPPVLHCQNLPCDGEIYGISDLEPELQNLQDKICLEYSNVAKMVRLFAHPRIVAKAMGEFQPNPNSGIENVIELASPDSSIEALEFKADIKAALDVIEGLQQQFWAAAGIPDLRPQKEGAGWITGVSIEMMYKSFEGSIKKKRKTYGPLIVSLVKAVCEFKGIEVSNVKIAWPDVMPIDKKAQAETAVKMQEAGWSRQTSLEQSGADWDVERARSEAEFQEDLKRAEALAKINAPQESEDKASSKQGTKDSPEK